jgi:protein-tyrosine-phosphatase
MLATDVYLAGVTTTLGIMDVLFVCTGNTCRSPMAEAIMRRLIEERGLALNVDSAGLRAESNIAPQAVRALRRRDIQLDERAAVQLTEEMVDRASLVLCMTEEQRQILAEAMPASTERVFAWGDFLARSAIRPRSPQDRPLDRASSAERTYDVPDPVGQDDAVYESTAAAIERLCVATLRALATP